MGFETVVRPAVFPNIRPAAPRALPIADAPDNGVAVISGGGASSVISLPKSEAHSWSRSRMVEVRRVYDKARVYYTRPDGTLDKSKYWEFEVLRSITFLENGKLEVGQRFAPLRQADNILVFDKNLTRENK